MTHNEATEIDQQLRDFVRQRYGLRGTLRLHRIALGYDLLRAPANVLLAPVFLLTRLAGLAAKWAGRSKLATWFLSRNVLLQTDVARRVASDTEVLLTGLAANGALAAPPDKRQRAIADYAGIRSAVAEITTMLVLLTTGWLLFHAATPGLISLAGPVAELRAETQAIGRFPLGPGIGRAWFSVFPVGLSTFQVVSTGVMLAVLASLITTFAGIVADPVQWLTGMHRRRLTRLINRLARDGSDAPLAREHLAARAGDISDLILSVVRFFRG